MISFNQGAWVSGTENYRYGHNSIPNVRVTGAPADTDWSRWTMLHDDKHYRLFAFRKGIRDKLYPFAWNGESYAYAYKSAETLSLTNVPADANTNSISMLHDGRNHYAYLHRRDDPGTLYRLVWVPGKEKHQGSYQWNHGEHVNTLRITGFPDDTDWSRWAMLHDGRTSRIYAFHGGRRNRIFQGSLNAAVSEYQYGFRSIPELTPKGFPANSDFNQAAMVHDGRDYRLYFQAL